MLTKCHHWRGLLSCPNRVASFSMKFLDVSRQLWSPCAAINVAEIAIFAEGVEYRGRGRIAVGEHSATLSVTLTGDAPLPSKGSGSYDSDDFWLIAGIVDEEVGFWLKSLPGGVRSDTEKRKPFSGVTSP